MATTLQPLTPHEVLAYTRSTDTAMAVRVATEYNRTWAGATVEQRDGRNIFTFPPRVKQ